MLTRLIVTVGMTAILGCAQGDPAAVAEAFWRAGQEGDIERARSYVSASSHAKMNERSAPSIDELWIGESEIDGDRATVQTRLSTSTDRSFTIEFNTIMVREEGDWKVELDDTSSEMMREIFGSTMEEMGEQLGEAMKGAVEGMAEGMAEGMQKMGEAMQDAAKDLQRKNP